MTEEERRILVSTRLFAPSPALVAKLTEVQEQRGPDDIATTYGAFMLDPGLGPPTYLTRDGRIVWDDDAWGVVGTRAEALMAILAGLKKNGVLTLRELLPRDAAATDCRDCSGTGWFDANGQLRNMDGEAFSVVCSMCAGLGWTSPAVVLTESVLERTLADGEEIAQHSNGQDWLVSWHPPASTPEGKPHGSAGICITEGGRAVLISCDGLSWDFPAGRPEGDETWEETLRREVLEEACAKVSVARLLGYVRGRCIRGHEAGLVLVRSIWVAEVTLSPWEPEHEISHRRLVALDEVLRYLPRGFAPINRRALSEIAKGRT